MCLNPSLHVSTACALPASPYFSKRIILIEDYGLLCPFFFFFGWCSELTCYVRCSFATSHWVQRKVFSIWMFFSSQCSEKNHLRAYLIATNQVCHLDMLLDNSKFRFFCTHKMELSDAVEKIFCFVITLDIDFDLLMVRLVLHT